MKDFDFDELDRAVNSVLATKDTKNTQATDKQTSDAPQPDNTNNPADQVNTSDTSATVDHVEPEVQDAEESTNPVSVVDDDQDESTSVSVNVGAPSQEDEKTDEHSDVQDSHSAVETHEDADQEHDDEMPLLEAETEDEKSTDIESNTSDTTSVAEKAPLSSIPAKRGRFMDMVAPGTSASGDSSKKSFPSRSGVTIAPSVDFAPEQDDKEDSHSEPVRHTDTVDPATPVVDGEIEPDVTSSSSDIAPDVEKNESSSSDEPQADLSSVESVSPVAPTDTTPFIPDVPVEKRPLNDLSEKPEATEDTAAPEQTAPAGDPTLTSNAPKEFDKDIMAVEANETVGERDETHSTDTESQEKHEESDSKEDSTVNPSLAATTAEPHPMFDTSTLAHPGDLATHHTSKLSWAVVALSLFVVGAALGVLYFLYGQG